jgi:transcriptional regulator with XRE-family HTH domain
MTTATARPVGQLLREWRERRRLSQLELSSRTEISARHISFVETGRARPSAQLILRLTEHLDVPLRDRNRVLLAGGYAPAYPETALDAPRLSAVREAVRRVLTGHAPYPAAAVDRHWHLVDANAGIALFTEGCAQWLLTPPVNALRLSLHPDGMAPRITNLPQWRAHLLHRLRRQASASADPELEELHAELASYPAPSTVDESGPSEADRLVVPLRYRHGDRELSFFSTTAVLGTPLDVTLAELAIESFFPADAQTASYLSRRAPA